MGDRQQGDLPTKRVSKKPKRLIEKSDSGRGNKKRKEKNKQDRKNGKSQLATQVEKPNCLSSSKRLTLLKETKMCLIIKPFSLQAY